MAKLLNLFPLVEVAAVVPKCGDEYLLPYNVQWMGYTFPMTKHEGPSLAGVAWIDAARRAAAEILAPGGTPGNLSLRSDFANYLQSDNTGETKRYHFQVFDMPLENKVLIHPGLLSLWLTAEEIRGAVRPLLSPTVERILDNLFPLRSSVGSWAVISYGQENQRTWLGQWNNHWKRFHFVGGRKELSTESHRDCVTRKVAAELRLPRTEYSVDPHPLDQPPTYSGWSWGHRQTTEYTIELYRVHLTQKAQAAATRAPENRWLYEAEIAAGKTRDGKAISDEMRWVLQNPIP